MEELTRFLVITGILFVLLTGMTIMLYSAKAKESTFENKTVEQSVNKEPKEYPKIPVKEPVSEEVPEETEKVDETMPTLPEASIPEKNWETVEFVPYTDDVQTENENGVLVLRKGIMIGNEGYTTPVMVKFDVKFDPQGTYELGYCIEAGLADIREDDGYVAFYHVRWDSYSGTFMLSIRKKHSLKEEAYLRREIDIEYNDMPTEDFGTIVLELNQDGTLKLITKGAVYRLYDEDWKPSYAYDVYYPYVRVCNPPSKLYIRKVEVYEG